MNLKESISTCDYIGTAIFFLKQVGTIGSVLTYA